MDAEVSFSRHTQRTPSIYYTYYTKKKTKLLHPTFTGYYPKFVILQNAIKKLSPKLEVEGAAGRASSFEVTYNGSLLFSKLKDGNFPDFQRLAEQIASYVAK